MAITGGTEQINVGNIYLMKIYSSLQEVYVEKITKTAFKFRKERADGSWYVDWVEKKGFHQHHAVLEHLDKPINPPTLENENVSIDIDPPQNSGMKACPICSGSGQIPDDSVTVGTKTCPKCGGSGLIYTSFE